MSAAFPKPNHAESIGMSSDATERLKEITQQTGASPIEVMEALLLRGIPDTSPLTLRKLFPKSGGRVIELVAEGPWFRGQRIRAFSDGSTEVILES